MAEEADITKSQANRALSACLSTITDALGKGESVALIGFGSFSVKERAKREGRNPRTGEKITIEKAIIPSFKAGKTLKDAVQLKSYLSEATKIM